MIDALQYAAMHDKFFDCHVLRIPHGKLRFCMTSKRAFSCLCSTDSRVMPDKHDKLAFFQTQTFLQLINPDEEHFFLHLGGRADGRLAPSTVEVITGVSWKCYSRRTPPCTANKGENPVSLRKQPIARVAHPILISNVKMSGSGRFRDLSCIFRITQMASDAGKSITGFEHAS